ncbi:AbfB domain-containing protein [Actinoplanes sp. NPDC051861]|uniref:AbfB domain-containing protein n=1 Tax=Actinoplanes sp. NPDC051861 TaxID=3155170 RepID=UPI003422E663
MRAAAVLAAGVAVAAVVLVVPRLAPESRPPGAGAHWVPAGTGAGDRSAPAVVPSRPGAGSLPPVAGFSAVPLTAMSLEAVSAPGRFVTVTDEPGTLRAITVAGPVSRRRAATFRVIRGLAEPGCYTFRAADGRYLRHMSFQLRLSPDDGTELFRRDATFCARAGTVPGSVLLEAHNYPGFLVRHLGDDLWLDRFDGSAAFLTESSFAPRPPLAS